MSHRDLQKSKSCVKGFPFVKTGSSSDVQVSDAECPICHDDYTVPKLLPCAHIICRKCLQSWMEKSGNDTRCPLCRAQIFGLPSGKSKQDTVASPDCATAATALTRSTGSLGGLDPPRDPMPHANSTGATSGPASEASAGATCAETSEDPTDRAADLLDGLPTDLATQALVESKRILDGGKECGICEDIFKLAVSFCLQCCVKLCESCSKHHGKFPDFQEHVLEKLSELTANRLALLRPTACDINPNKAAELYCRVHQVFLCLICAASTHRACECSRPADVAGPERNRLSARAKKLREAESNLAGQINQVGEEIQSTRNGLRAARDAVRTTFDDLQETIETRRRELNNFLQRQECRLAPMQDHKLTLEQAKTAVSSHAGLAERLVDSAPDRALLGMLAKLETRLGEVQTRDFIPEPRDIGQTDDQPVITDSSLVLQIQQTIRQIGVAGQPPSDLGQPSSGSGDTASGCSGFGPTKPTGADLAAVLKVGDRVRRTTEQAQTEARFAPGHQGIFGVMGPGTVTQIPSEQRGEGWVQVHWDGSGARPDIRSYRMGAEGCYDLELV